MFNTCKWKIQNGQGKDMEKGGWEFELHPLPACLQGHMWDLHKTKID